MSQPEAPKEAASPLVLGFLFTEPNALSSHSGHWNASINVGNRSLSLKELTVLLESEELTTYQVLHTGYARQFSHHIVRKLRPTKWHCQPLHSWQTTDLRGPTRSDFRTHALSIPPVTLQTSTKESKTKMWAVHNNGPHVTDQGSNQLLQTLILQQWRGQEKRLERCMGMCIQWFGIWILMVSLFNSPNSSTGRLHLHSG